MEPSSSRDLRSVARAMVAPGKGILAMDESVQTCNKRFLAEGIEPTEEQRRRYRQLLVTAPGIEPAISGAILFDETFRQRLDDGATLPEYLASHGILPGIKVDTGAMPLAGFPGETVTEGLDSLRERLSEYRGLGAAFAKWRAVVHIGEGRPTQGAISANAHALARYAALCQESDVVPIVEPEVMMEGNHDRARCADVTGRVLEATFEQLACQRVGLDGMVLKPNMVVPGAANREPAGSVATADATVAVLMRTVPSQVPGVAFLSGGQSDEDATINLDLINRRHPGLPWRITFSYGRALQRPALETWRGRPELVEEAQRRFAHRVRMNAAASQGGYSPDLDLVGAGA
jgi:fructose-bisphosphate aldolase class I